MRNGARAAASQPTFMELLLGLACESGAPSVQDRLPSRPKRWMERSRQPWQPLQQCCRSTSCLRGHREGGGQGETSFEAGACQAMRGGVGGGVLVPNLTARQGRSSAASPLVLLSAGALLRCCGVLLLLLLLLPLLPRRRGLWLLLLLLSSCWQLRGGCWARSGLPIIHDVDVSLELLPRLQL